MFKEQHADAMTVAGLPDEGLAQVDAIYCGLKAASDILSQGRMYGLAVAVSPAIATIIRARHGIEAEAVLANCQSLTL